MTGAVTIRLASVAEQEELEALQWRASLMWEEDRDALLAHPDSIELPVEQILNGQAFVAEKDEKIVGFSVVLPRPDHDAELDGLFVEPRLWRTGIGARLVAAAAALAAENGAKFLHVVGNRRAADFYYACGFMLIGQEQTRFGVGLTMRKSCSASS